MRSEAPFAKSDAAFFLICLIFGQLMFALTTFYWEEDGRYSVTTSTLAFFSMLFWAMGFIYLYSRLWQVLPRISAIGLLYALYGIFGGVVFAVEGLFEQALGLTKIGVQASESFPLAMNLVMYSSGPAFPLSLLLLGILLPAKRIITWPAGILLAVSGLAFPVGRILRNELVAHVTDVLMLAAVVWIAVQLWRQGGAFEVR